MKRFLEQCGDKVMGVLNGLDRVRFRGTLRWIANEQGVSKYLSHAGVLLKDFGNWAEGMTKRIRESCAEQAKALGIPTIYLERGGVDKEALVRRRMEEEGRHDGSVCMLSVVEPCMAPQVKGDRATQKLTLRLAERKCVWVYHYWDHPQVGFGHVRLQTWMPFQVDMCMNGRHWLEKLLVDHGLGYRKDGNCFPWLEDMGASQALMDGQLATDWPSLLDRLLLETCPSLREIIRPLDFTYYWSADETEWATDVMFKSAADVAAWHPRLLRHAMLVSDSPSVLRYLGHGRAGVTGQLGTRLPKEVTSDYRRRTEGVRVKHWINRNSQKTYTKAGTVMRFENTMVDTRAFKVFRQANDDRRRKPAWQPLRKGVRDLHRRCDLSQKANERHMDALAVATAAETLGTVAAHPCNAHTRDGRHYRALNPWNRDDQRMLAFLCRGEWHVNGFRNVDLRRCLYPERDTADQETGKRTSARVTRLVRLMRAHGLVRKIPKANRYVVTSAGQKFSQSVVAASNVDIEQLMKMAA